MYNLISLSKKVYSNNLKVKIITTPVGKLLGKDNNLFNSKCQIL